MEDIKLSPKGFLCENCETRIDAPVHCGRPMSLELTDSPYWICWKGDHAPCCGKEAMMDYESCCAEPELQADVVISGQKLL